MLLLPSRGGVYSNLLYLECKFQYLDDDDECISDDDDDDEYNSDDDGDEVLYQLCQ